MRSLRLLNLRRLRHQPLRAALAIVAVAAGVAIAISVVIVTSSASSSIRSVGRQLAGPASLRVIGATSRGGLDEAVLARVEATPGVAAAAPVVQAVTLGEGTDRHTLPILALGVDCRAASIMGISGPCPAGVSGAGGFGPAEPAPIVAPALVAELGPGGVIRTDVGRVAMATASTAAPLDAVNQGRLAIFSLATAQRLFGRPHLLDVIYVRQQPGTDLSGLKARLAAAVGPWNGVLRATEPPPQAGVILTAFVPLLGLASVFALGVGAVLIYNTVALSLAERRRDLAIVAALGGRRRTVAGGALVEAALLGLTGGILGELGGIALARPIVASLSDFTQKAVGIPLVVHANRATLVAAAALGVLVSVLASWPPVRRALRQDVAAELSNRDLRLESAPSLRAWRAGIYTFVGAAGIVGCWVAQRHGALEPWQPRLGYVSLLAGMIGLLLACGALAPLLVRLALRPSRHAAAWFRLGLANLVREPGRAGVMTVATASAIGTAFIIASFVTSIDSAITKGVTSANNGAVWVSTTSPSNTLNIDAKLSPSVVEAVGRVPGVESVEHGAVLLTGHRAGQLVGVDASQRPSMPFPVVNGSKDLAAFAQGRAFVGANLARTRHLRAGSLVRLDTPHGYAEVPVQGVVMNGDFGGNIVTIPLDLLNRLWGPQPVQGVSVHPVPGVSTDELARRIRASGLDPDLQVQTPRHLAGTVSADVSRQMAPFWVLQRGITLVAFIAVLSTLLLVGVQRRRELGLLAAVGMRPIELSRMLFAEAAAVGVLGVVLGTTLGVGMFEALREIGPILIGYHDPFVVDPRAIAVYGPLTVALVIAAAGWPAWRTARLEVLEALQYE